MCVFRSLQPGANRTLGVPTASKVQEYLEDGSDVMRVYKASEDSRKLDGNSDSNSSSSNSRFDGGRLHHDRDPDFLFSYSCDLWK